MKPFKIVLSIFYLGSIICASDACCSPKQDPTVTLEETTTEKLSKEKFHNEFKLDPRTEKWLLSFHEIPGYPEYSIVMKRVAQAKPGVFFPFSSFTSQDILKAKLLGEPIRIAVCAAGFIPGEEITVRLRSRDDAVYKERTFCPRPLVLKKKSGEILMKAKLLNDIPTIYSLAISGLDPDEKYQFKSTSAHEKMRQVFQGNLDMNYLPEVVGIKGGVAEIELSFDNNASYTMRLPWGDELRRYLRGEK